MNTPPRAWQIVAATTFALALFGVLALPLLEDRDSPTDPQITTAEPHWEFRVLRVAGSAEEGDQGMSLEAERTWVGPIPYNGVGSVCRVIGLDANGNATHSGERFYLSAPLEEWERTGGAMGAELPADSVDAELRCEPYSGRGFQVVGQPELDVDKETVFGTAELRWSEPKLRTSSFWCEVSLFDSAGDLIRKSVAGPNAAFWPPGDYKGPPPYTQDMNFLFQLRSSAPKPKSAEVECSLDRPVV
jgi:hypothetical protein